MAQKQTGPLQNLYSEIKQILDFIEFKDGNAAKKAETAQSASKAEVYMNAMHKRDSYITYKNWWTRDMFKEISFNIKTVDYRYYIENPYNVPVEYRESLLEQGRQAYLDQYVEENSYYRMIMGLPALDDTEFIYLSKDLQEKYHVDPNTPVHELSTYTQMKYMETDEYKQVVLSNPSKSYLKYFGSYKIELYTARSAKDFDIIRYPAGRTDLNPNLLTEFPKSYADSREYIMVTLYNYNMEDTYRGYRTFMEFLILCYALMHINIKSVETIIAHKCMDDTMLYIILSMYGIPDTLLLTKEVRRKLAIKVLNLIKEKGTNEVYYDIIDILGYQDIVISKLMLMKGQKFDENGTALDDYEPYFLSIDLKDENQYESIVNGNARLFSYESIINNDSSWWDTEEVRQILQDKQYSEADSKYIMIEAVIHQMKSMFETIYFSRMIIDNKTTDEFMITIPEIFGTKQVSIYDCIVFLICATCMVNGLSGEIYTDQEKLLATSGFNFDINMDELIDFIDNSSYIEKERLKKFISNISIENESDISRVYSGIMYPLREWLENKIVTADTRKEFLEYEAVYRALFTYDITRNKILDDFKSPLKTIQEKYELTDDDMKALKYFYPHKSDGSAVTIEEFSEDVNKTKYRYPFLSLNYKVAWNINVKLKTKEDRGHLYFYDILNCDDIRTLKNENDEFIFMDYEDPEIGWQINQDAVDAAIAEIDKLESDELNAAYFQIYTPTADGEYYNAGEKLPTNIRSSVFKSILIDKIKMDAAGFAQPPKSYFDYLYRKNEEFYNILFAQNIFSRNREGWMNNVQSVTLAIENALSLHMKYLEQSIIGKDLFFQPLITLISHFKSLLVTIVKTDLKYIFDDKMDAGGNSNMLKLFDQIKTLTHHSIIKSTGYDADMRLYDTIQKTKLLTHLYDRSETIRTMIGEGFAAEEKIATVGSIHMSDEMKFFKNGAPIDSEESSMWYSGNPGSGRWSEEDDVLMKSRVKNNRIYNAPVDLEGWKDFVESYKYQ